MNIKNNGMCGSSRSWAVALLFVMLISGCSNKQYGAPAPAAPAPAPMPSALPSPTLGPGPAVPPPPPPPPPP